MFTKIPLRKFPLCQCEAEGMDEESQRWRMEDSCNPMLCRQADICGIMPTDRLIHDLILSIWVYLLWPPARRGMKCVMKYSCCCSRIIGLNNLSARHLDNYLQSKKISHALVIVSNGNEMQKDCKTGVSQHALMLWHISHWAL